MEIIYQKHVVRIDKKKCEATLEVVENFREFFSEKRLISFAQERQHKSAHKKMLYWEKKKEEYEKKKKDDGNE